MKSVIVVEDDLEITEMLKIVLAGLNVDLIFFDRGEPIIDGNYTLPDLFLLDKNLPGIDGLDVCRYLKSTETTRNIPVIMMSANLRIAELSEAAGADDMIMKPFNIKELKKMVQAYLDEKGAGWIF